MIIRLGVLGLCDGAVGRIILGAHCSGSCLDGDLVTLDRRVDRIGPAQGQRWRGKCWSGGNAGQDGAATVGFRHGFISLCVMTRQGGKPHRFVVFVKSVIVSPAWAVGGKWPRRTPILRGCV
jgi:hypothetical protein